MADATGLQLSQRHFMNTADLPQQEIQALIDLALSLKHGEVKPSLAGKTLATLFFNPSVRTRVSFATAMFKLGGQALDLSMEGAWSFEFGDGVVMDGATIEHVKEVAPVLSRYCDGLAIRCSELVTKSAASASAGSWQNARQDLVLNSFARYATVPVINMESNVYHPCQGLGDAVTIKEQLGQPQGKKYVLTWAYHPKALPMATPNSQMLAACDLGMNVTLAYPEGWDLDPEIVKMASQRAKQSGGSLQIEHDMDTALEGAHIVCAKSWGALQYYGNWEAEKALRVQHKDWMVTQAKMQHTDNGRLMHCLPVRRNVEVGDDVLDSPTSIVIDEAENRLWAQMALLATLL
ncbi:N-acetylornithine carbamoyltransferase [Ktedonosporobacter rubrisoli]|uniref:N-acetylornithine carbamoyltransferase n=1 Tax=Ktedonosporobacter rubrisoli TaxID=2509675 RepID=A0A4P6JPS0_KTERU|nr:N-acetylornithine carbamoyltransferase [Ktedonosporobacter rubrisoli]QBD76766.1 N-acetylornithine carbamoyltransferase [Ktedonosporobacter rubrisoli]